MKNQVIQDLQKKSSEIEAKLKVLLKLVMNSINKLCMKWCAVTVTCTPNNCWRVRKRFRVWPRNTLVWCIKWSSWKRNWNKKIPNSCILIWISINMWGKMRKSPRTKSRWNKRSKTPRRLFMIVNPILDVRNFWSLKLSPRKRANRKTWKWWSTKEIFWGHS